MERGRRDPTPDGLQCTPPDCQPKMSVSYSITRSSATQPSNHADFPDLRLALDQIDIDNLVVALEGPPRTGRRPAPRRSIIRAYLASYALGISSLSDLIRRLHNEPLLRSICEFANYLPSYATFWRVFDQLSGMPEQIDECCQILLKQLHELLPDLGQEVAVDSTTIPAYANPNRKHSSRNPGGPADPDVSWTKKHNARDPSQEEWVFGYKAHVVADANYDLPLQMVVTTASQNDTSLLAPLLSGLQAWCEWFRLANGAIVIADRGYDAQRNNQFVHCHGGIPVIHKRRPPGGKLHDGIYTTNGVPTCLGQVEMEYITFGAS